jgi:hypothetical protein
MTKQQQDRLKELTAKMMRNYYFSDDFTQQDYDEYCKLSSIQQDEYRQENEPKLKEYFEQHIKGKTWDEVNKDDFSFYSDWHKEVYGFRPRTLAYCGRK